jgi:hypothetical protein
MLSNRLAVLNKHLNPKLINFTQLTAIERWAFGRAYLTTATEYLQNHDKDKAYDCLAKMVCIYPELLRELETFYELGCGDQLKGSRGDFATLDLQTNANVLLDMLDKIFANLQASPGLRSNRKLVYANAYLALGLLSYGARNYQLARGFLLHSILNDPLSGFNHRFITTWLKILASYQAC